MDNAFEWIEKNGIALESTYPYTSGGGQTGSCDKSKAIPAVTISSFKDVPKCKGSFAYWVLRDAQSFAQRRQREMGNPQGDTDGEVEAQD